MPSHPGFRRTTLIRTICALLIVLALLGAVVAGLLYANRGYVRFTLFEKDAGDLLKQMIADTELPVSQATDVERIAADGTQPDMAMQTLIIPSTADAIRRGFQNGCQRAGLGAPDAMTRGSEPEAICTGAWRGGSALVSVQLRCAADCQADVTVQHLWF